MEVKLFFLFSYQVSSYIHQAGAIHLSHEGGSVFSAVVFVSHTSLPAQRNPIVFFVVFSVAGVLILQFFQAPLPISILHENCGRDVRPGSGLVSVYMDEQRPDKYWFSPEKWVNPQTPPFFLWQTTDMDDPRNMFCFAKELADAGVRFEAHISPFGPHGMAMANGTGLGPKDAHVAHWFTQATEWLDIYGFGGEKA